jgi:hypothetical protein
VRCKLTPSHFDSRKRSLFWLCCRRSGKLVGVQIIEVEYIAKCSHPLLTLPLSLRLCRSE